MPKGFPTQQDEAPKSIRPPAPQGTLVSYMEKNFPEVAKQVKKVVRHPKRDMRDSKQTRKTPTQSGRYP